MLRDWQSSTPTYLLRERRGSNFAVHVLIRSFLQLTHDSLSRQKKTEERDKQKREGERQRQRQRETGRQPDRQTDGQTDRRTDRHGERSHNTSKMRCVHVLEISKGGSEKELGEGSSRASMQMQLT